MGLDKLFFPHRLTYAHELDSARKRQLRAARRSARRAQEARERLDALEDDLGYLALVLAAVMQRLDEHGSVTRDQVRSLMSELDGLDDLEDGRLSVEVLKQVTQDDS